MIVPDTTTEQQAFKNRTFTFEVPTTMDAAQPYGYEIVTGHVYVIDTKDVTITKTGRLPEDAQDQQFRFKYSCEGGTPHEDIIRVGARFTIAGVPVAAPATWRKSQIPTPSTGCRHRSPGPQVPTRGSEISAATPAPKQSSVKTTEYPYGPARGRCQRHKT